MNAPRRRVVVYALCEVAGGDHHLLVFRQPGRPQAGVQVPAGGMGDGETPLEAAMRELLEESGLDGRAPTLLGHAREAHPDGQVCDNWYVRVSVDQVAGRWEHVVAAGEADAGMTFECSFVSLEQAGVVVHPSQRAMLSMVDEP